MKRLVLLLMLVIFLTSGCQPQVPLQRESTSTPVEMSVVDPAKESLPQRIISLSPPLTEMLFAVGAGGQLVGRDSYSDFPEEAKSVTDVGWTYGKYNMETVVNLKPDLVLAGEITTPEMVASLKNLGLRVEYFKNPAMLNDVYAMLERIGQLSGQINPAQNLIQHLQQRESELVKKLSGIRNRPMVFYELDASDPSKPYTPGPGTLYSNLIAMAGGVNLGDQLGTSWAQISLEQLLVDDPDLILLGDSAYGITPESVAQRSGWQSLKAVKEGRVLPFDDNLLLRYGPRILDGLEALAKILHPELFSFNP